MASVQTLSRLHVQVIFNGGIMNDKEKAQIKDTLEQAQKNLDELSRSITQARQAGLDTTYQEQRERELRQKISRMRTAFGV